MTMSESDFDDLFTEVQAAFTEEMLETVNTAPTPENVRALTDKMCVTFVSECAKRLQFTGTFEEWMKDPRFHECGRAFADRVNLRRRVYGGHNDSDQDNQPVKH
jgi:hypothetical protein